MNGADGGARVDAIVARELTKVFDGRTVVDRLSFTVPFGAITGFVGGNGSGKTTTMRMIAGLVRPSSGTSTVAGVPFTELPNPRRALGASLDHLGAIPGMSARQHLTALSISADVPVARVAELLSTVGLDAAADRKVKTYSTGMRQRLGLGAALLGEPSILLLDEPSNGLDPAGIRWLRDLLQGHAANGGAAFVSTHHLAELDTIVDHLVVIAGGRLVAAGPVDEVLDQAAATSIEDLLMKETNS